MADNITTDLLVLKRDRTLQSHPKLHLALTLA